MTIATSLLAVAMLSGGITPASIEEGWKSCERDGRTQQFAPVDHITRLLVMESDGQAVGTPAPRGLQPITVTHEHVAYMQALNLDSVDILLDGKPSFTPGFGVTEGGIYRLSVQDLNHLGCTPYLDALAKLRELGLDASENINIAPTGRCLVLTKVERDPSIYSHFIVSFTDSAATTAGFFLRRTQLRTNDGDVAVQASLYLFEPPRAPTCSQNRNAPTLAKFLSDMN